MSGTITQDKDKAKAKRLPKIDDEEKMLMQKWLQKEHGGSSHLNARWIKGGGGVGMSMTESKAVKTSGAYESLAKYINSKLESKPQPNDAAFWTPKIASTRFTAAFKAYSDACKMGSKSDSGIGANEDEVRRQVNYNAILLAKQVKACPMFVVFNALYSEHPSVNPVMSVGMGKGMPVGDVAADDEDVVECGSGDEEDRDKEGDEKSKEVEGDEGKSKADAASKQSTSSKKGGSKSDDKSVKETAKKTFTLKEGAKKADFTTVWAATMNGAKDAKLEFEKTKYKREREDKRTERKMQEKRMKNDLLISLMQKGYTQDEIKFYMQLAGHDVTLTH